MVTSNNNFALYNYAMFATQKTQTLTYNLDLLRRFKPAASQPTGISPQPFVTLPQNNTLSLLKRIIFLSNITKSVEISFSCYNNHVIEKKYIKLQNGAVTIGRYISDAVVFRGRIQRTLVAPAGAHYFYHAFTYSSLPACCRCLLVNTGTIKKL